MHVNTDTHYLLKESVCEEISWFQTFLYVCVCVCKHGPATYMVTKAQSRAHTSDIKHTYGPLRPNYFKFTLWGELCRFDTPTQRSWLAEALGNVDWACCDWRRGGMMGGDARRRLHPAGTAPRTITGGRSSTTEWKKREGRGRKEEKKKKKRKNGANLCAVAVDWKGKFGAQRHGSTLSPWSFSQPELRASASD